MKQGDGGLWGGRRVYFKIIAWSGKASLTVSSLIITIMSMRMNSKDHQVFLSFFLSFAC